MDIVDPFLGVSFKGAANKARVGAVPPGCEAWV